MNDLISRQAAIDAVKKDMYADKDYMSAIICEGIENVLNSLPTAEPEHGKWIMHPSGKFVGFPYVHYECDQCRDFEPEARNYCPNCGAKMEDNDAS